MSSYPPPPGINNSLPPRPPPAINSFARFAPRQITTAQPAQIPLGHRQVSYGAPTTNDYVGGYQPSGSSSSANVYGGFPPATSSASYPAGNSTVSSAPHIVNPFPLPGTGPGTIGGRKSTDPRFADLDPELQAQIAQQQSIYDPSNAENLKARTQSKPAIVIGEAGCGGGKNNNTKTPTVIRQGGGQTWSDSTLLEWDPSHFRIFVGNLAGEVTDDSLLKAFSKYTSVKKARVVRDKRTTKSKGYGFVAFGDGDEYFRAAREMQGKYIGSHPVLLKRSNTEIKPVITGGNKTKGGRISKDKKKKNKASAGEKRNVLG